MKIFVLIATLVAILVSGCGVDKNAAKYDQLRYDELQKSNCNDMAAVLSAAGIMEKPEEFEVALKRCQDTQSLDFEQYRQLAEHGRETGAWDVYEVFPGKR